MGSIRDAGPSENSSKTNLRSTANHLWFATTHHDLFCWMVSVSKFSPIPRLSIVVPVGHDLAAFETTLISVLENRPENCEVLVSHDGRYDDPFDLSDEVKFVVAPSPAMVDLVRAATSVAMGRFVHVLAEGIQATADWTEAAIEKFESFDVGVVVPVIRNQDSGRIVSAGWFDGADRLAKPFAVGKRDVPTPTRKKIGAQLQASFWRRDLLSSLADAFDSRDATEASYAYEFLIREAGWRCVIADECELTTASDALVGEEPSLGRGRRLRAIRHCFTQGGWSSAIQSSMVAGLANLVRPSMWMESLGQAFAPISESKFDGQLHVELVSPCNDNEVIHRMPIRTAIPIRRAA
jgi:hypothetical protein